MRGATAFNCIDVAVRVGGARREFAARDKFDGDVKGVRDFCTMFLFIVERANF